MAGGERGCACGGSGVVMVVAAAMAAMAATVATLAMVATMARERRLRDACETRNNGVSMCPNACEGKHASAPRKKTPGQVDVEAGSEDPWPQEDLHLHQPRQRPGGALRKGHWWHGRNVVSSGRERRERESGREGSEAAAKVATAKAGGRLRAGSAVRAAGRERVCALGGGGSFFLSMAIVVGASTASREPVVHASAISLIRTRP